MVLRGYQNFELNRNTAVLMQTYFGVRLQVNQLSKNLELVDKAVCDATCDTGGWSLPSAEVPLMVRVNCNVL